MQQLNTSSMRVRRILPAIILLAAASLFPEPAAHAQGSSFCAIERAQGRYPPGCPRATQRQPDAENPVAARRSRGRTPAPRLTRYAAGLQRALANISESQWLSQSYPELPTEPDPTWQSYHDHLYSLARVGNARARYLLAQHYRELGNFDGRRMAVHWYRQAASLGEPLSQWALGRILVGVETRGFAPPVLEYFGIPEDQAEGLRLIRRAAAAGVAPARQYLGNANSAQ